MPAPTPTPSPGSDLVHERLIHVAGDPTPVYSSRLADLPERILASKPAVVVEGPNVAAADFDSLALDRGSGDRPFRHPAVAASEVIVVPVMDVRNAFEARRKT